MKSRLIFCDGSMVYQEVRRCCYDTNEDGQYQDTEQTMR